MESHGFGRKTFQFETDAHGNAVVYHVIGKLEDTAYHDEAGIIWDEIREQFDRSKHIYLTALDVSSELIGTGGGDTACGVGSGSTNDGDALLPAAGGCFDFEVAAHELGHAFGLQHDFRSDAYLMSYGSAPDKLSQCAAEWLDVHSAFNSNQPASTAAATIEMLPLSLASPPNAIRLRFKVSDPDGLHQAQLQTDATDEFQAPGSPKLIGCKALSGKSSTTVEFVTTFLTPKNISVYLAVMDVNGDFTTSDPFIVRDDIGPKIEGPWLWVITPTDRRSGSSAAVSGIDFLSEMSDGAVTESKIATNGATVGAPVGDSVWTLHKLSPTGRDNINDMVKAAGLGIGDIDYHVAYGSIALDTPREQRTEMFAGSDDAVKVWLNGELVHNNPVDRPANDFQESFPVTLKKGKNILLVVVYEGWGEWSGFFGFDTDAEYTLTLPTNIADRPAWDVNEDDITDATDAMLVTAALGQQQPENPRLDVNGDGVVDGKDLALVAEHLGEGDAPAAPSSPALLLGFTLDTVEHALNILRVADDGTLTFKRGIDNLERLLALFVPENTALLHNYPNPFNPETWIPYQLATPAEVTLRIYAVNGALVRTLALGHQPAGAYRIRSRAAYWDGRNVQGEKVASGIYFYTLSAGEFTATRKMLIRK